MQTHKYVDPRRTFGGDFSVKNGLHLLKGVKNVETIALKTKNTLHKVVVLEITCTRTIFVLTVIYTGAMPFGTVPSFLLVPVSQLLKRFE